MKTRFLLASGVMGFERYRAQWPTAPPRPRPSCPFPDQLQPLSRVKDYRVVLQTCQGDSGKRLAVRAMSIDGDDLLLTVDPQSLATQLERKDCWKCDDTTQPQQAGTRFIDAVNRFAQQPGKVKPGWLENAGTDSAGMKIAASSSPATFAPPASRSTAVSCKSSNSRARRRPSPCRSAAFGSSNILTILPGCGRRKREGRLAITFVNHSFHHPYRPGVAEGRTSCSRPAWTCRKKSSTSKGC